jgi:hypothetical protein
VEESQTGMAGVVHYGRAKESQALRKAGTAAVEQNADCWGIEEAYLVNRRMAVVKGEGVVAEENSVVAARKGLAVDRTAVDMKGKHHYREEHRTALAAEDTPESPAIEVVSKIMRSDFL